VAPQVSSNEEYSTIPEEDREHIDEVVGRAHPAAENTKTP
jgi:hypothetical protein